MAVKTICDVGGEEDAKSVTIDVEGRKFEVDLCESHLSEFLSGAREVQRRRGRPAGSTGKKRGRPSKAEIAAREEAQQAEMSEA